MHSNPDSLDSPFLLHKIKPALLSCIFYHQWTRHLFSASLTLKQLKSCRRQYQTGLRSDFPAAFISHFPRVWQENSLGEAVTRRPRAGIKSRGTDFHPLPQGWVVTTYQLNSGHALFYTAHSHSFPSRNHCATHSVLKGVWKSIQPSAWKLFAPVLPT